MKSMLKKATLAVVLGATTMTVAAPAEAQRWRRYDRGNDAGTAIVAGIAGLAIGAALTSRDRYDPRYDYDYRYYDQRGYFPNNGYYAQNYYNDPRWDGGWNGGYNRGWDRGYGRGFNRCVVRRVYDPYIGRRVRVRYC